MAFKFGVYRVLEKSFMHNTMHIIILNMRQNLINKIEPADATHKVYLIIVQTSTTLNGQIFVK